MLRVGVHTDELTAGKGRHLNLPPCASVCGQLDRTHIATPGLLYSHRIPHAADTGGHSAVLHTGKELLVRPVGKRRAGRDIQHSPGHIRPPDGVVCAIPGTVVGQAVLIEAHFQPGVAEERVDIPCGGPVHSHQTLRLGRHLQHPIQTLDILVGKICLVVVQKIAVIRRQRVGVQGSLHAGRFHCGGERGATDGPIVLNGVQPAGGGQRGHLVVGKGEHVRAPLQVAQQHVLAV